MSEAKLGILGGMGPQATQDFYQRILDRTDAACDQEHLPTVILSDTRMPDRTAAILGGDAEGCYRRLLQDAKTLEQVGCTAIAIPCNTSHFFADRLQGELSVPIIHMVRETVKVLSSDPGVHKVGILATDGTVRTGVYQRECEAQGLAAFSPPPEVQKVVMSIIYDEIKKGEKGSREKFAVMDRCLREAGCDAAILGCTELSVYRTYHPLPEFYVDAMDILAERCITYCGYKLRMV